MSTYLAFVCTARQIDAPELRDSSVRVIGEILPFVLAKYGLGRVDRRHEIEPEVRREFEEPSLHFTI
jgi:hypothetical protein